MDSAGVFEFLGSLDFALALAGGLLTGFGAAQFSGFYPLRSSPLAPAGSPGKILILTASGLLIVMTLLLLAFIFLATAWAPALIAAGLALLAGPLLLQALPPQFAAGTFGVTLSLLSAAALSVLFLRRLIV